MQIFHTLKLSHSSSEADLPVSVTVDDVATSLVSAFVLSRLDYCNAILAGLPMTTIAPLQRAQNAAARLVARMDLVTMSVMLGTICNGCLTASHHLQALLTYASCSQ